MEDLKKHLPGLAAGTLLGFIAAKLLLGGGNLSNKEQTSETPAAAPAAAVAATTGASAVPKQRIFVLVSGVRCSGKDYTSKVIKTALWSRGIGCVRVAMGDGSKFMYAEQEGWGIDGFYRLLKDRDFKEQHRERLTQLYEKKIAEDRAYFHNLALQRAAATPASVVFITDARTEFDIEFFTKNAPGKVLTLRVHADDATRRKRGWEYDAKKDEHITETGLNKYDKWDLFVDSSNNDKERLTNFVEKEAIVKIKAVLGVTNNYVDDAETN